jgi:hypothetical protein
VVLTVEEKGTKEETEVARSKTNQDSPVSTVEAKDTKPLTARVPRSLKGIDKMVGGETVKEGPRKPLQ